VKNRFQSLPFKCILHRYISDLRLKLDGLQKEVLVQRKSIQDRDQSIQRFHHDLHATTQAIQVGAVTAVELSVCKPFWV
jgi:hypothetical protein